MRKACFDRDLAHRYWRRSRTTEAWELFKRLRDKAKQTEVSELHKHFSQKFDTKLNSKDLWKNINCLGYKNAQSTIKFFTSSDLVDQFTVNEAGPQLEYKLQGIVCRSNFCHTNIDLSDTVCAIESVKSNAIGNDGICPKFLRIILPHIAYYVHHIFNTILTTSIFPDAWKCAKVIPIPKKSAPSSTADFRPISI